MCLGLKPQRNHKLTLIWSTQMTYRSKCIGNFLSTPCEKHFYPSGVRGVYNRVLTGPWRRVLKSPPIIEKRLTAHALLSPVTADATVHGPCVCACATRTRVATMVSVRVEFSSRV